MTIPQIQQTNVVPEFDRNARKTYLSDRHYEEGAGMSCFPITLFLTVNNQCNLRCQMCDVGQKNPDTFFARNTFNQEMTMSLGDWKKVIDDSLPYRPDICIATTEPLLYPDLILLMEYINGKGLTLHLTTNGFLLERYAAQLVDIGFERLHVSLDGDQTMHDTIRGVPGAFKKAVKGIQSVAWLKEKRRTPYPEIHLYSVIVPLNYQVIDTTFESLAGLPVDSLNYIHFGFVSEIMAEAHNRRFGKSLYIEPSSVARLDPSEIDHRRLFQAVERTKALAEKTDFPVTFLPEMSKNQMDTYYHDHLSFMKEGAACMTPWKIAQISPNGDVVPLSRCFNIAMGNVKKSAITEIWNNSKYRQFRRHLKTNGAYPFCSRCCAIF